MTTSLENKQVSGKASQPLTIYTGFEPANLKVNEDQIKPCVGFIDYEKGFNSVKHSITYSQL